MNKNFLRLFSIIASGLVAAPAFADPTTAPSATATTQPAAAQAAKPKVDMAVAQDFVQKLRPDLGPIITAERSKASWNDAAKRAELATDANPALTKVLPMLDDMVEQGHSAEVEITGASDFVTMAAVLGDADLQKKVTEMAGRTDASGTWARVAQATAKFYLANDDTAAQGKALDGLAVLVSTEPAAKQSVVREELSIYESTKNKDISDQIDTYVSKTLKNPAIARIKEEKEADSKREALVGKPMVLAGLLKDGTQFTTADLKGKVILVDFWATWCGPCKAELPRVKKEYADMHDKGLEVIGVSFDQTGAALDKFLTANPDMPWPQMFDPKHPFWNNEFGKEFFIHGIPTMFLIDKNGICRSVTAREDFETMIPKLLAENSAT
jgi:thiol-disulfide isomerase/thioredoxin